MLPPAKAGVGSAVNDATRETGGTLGVAIIGSVYTSLYISRLFQDSRHALPQAALQAARSSVGAGYAAARRAPPDLRVALLDHVQGAFLAGLHAGCYVAAGVCALGILGALALPGPSSSVTTAPAPPALG